MLGRELRLEDVGGGHVRHPTSLRRQTERRIGRCEVEEANG